LSRLRYSTLFILSGDISIPIPENKQGQGTEYSGQMVRAVIRC
jgi:hypothetical protein